jgi:ATP-binding cassette subfamily C protein
MRNRSVSGYYLVLRDIWEVHGYRYAFFLVLLTVSGFVEGISLASVVPLLSAVGIGGAAPHQQNQLGAIAVRVLAGLGMQPTIEAIVLFVLAALASSSALYLLQTYVGARLQTEYVSIWQRRLASAIFESRWSFLVRQRHGDLVNSLVTEAPRLGGAFYQTGLMITGVLHGVIYLSVASLLSGWTTLVVLTGGGVLFLLTRPLIGRAYAIGTGISEDNAELQSVAGEMVRSAKSLKATATEPEAVEMLRDITGRLRNHLFQNSYDVQLAKGIFDFGAAAMVAGILYANHTIVHIDPSTTLVILAIFVRLMPKLTGLQQSLQSISVTVPSVRGLHDLVDALSEAEEPRDERPLPEQFDNGAFRISFDDVSIRHGDIPVIEGLNLEIMSGECVAFVGSSGAGKTTLVDALLGLVPVSAGAVKINGVPLTELPLTSVRKRVGYMGQEAMLYNTSIRRNVLWNHPDADEAEFTLALERAAARQFVDRLPAGSETGVGNAGALVSGGERQRIALARALLGDPGLIILDEATSALDAETEAAITTALDQQKGSATIVIVAHRLASVRMADRICVLENGAIVESGSWDELYAMENGVFRRLCDLQLGSGRSPE